MITKTAFKGMDNRHRAESLPEGYVRNAVNVLFDAMGKVSRINGSTQAYSGTDCHSLFVDGDIKYFIDNGDLISLDDTAITLASPGNEPMGFAKIGDKIYCGNGKQSYVIKTGLTETVETLGLGWTHQPKLVARESGGMFAGDYQVVITHRRNGIESGCGVAQTITLTEGQGIYFEAPTPPDDVDEIGVYCSTVNGSDLWLYGDYPVSTTEVFIDANLSDIRLETQFLTTPVFNDTLTSHYGRLYWAEGDKLYFTEPRKYNYYRAGNYHKFQGDITLIASVPGALYVCCDRTYRLSNIDGEGDTQRVEIFPYGAVKGSARYDERSKTAFWQSHKGIVAATAEGAQELIDKAIAYPKYKQGSTTIIERDGVRYLLALSRNGTASNLMDSTFKSEEITRKGEAV